MPPQTQWRDCQAWRDQGVPLSTTSNEAAKLYDAAISQLWRYREDPSLGGMEGTVTKMMEADPNFVMAHILATGMPVISHEKSFENDPDLQKTLDDLVKLSQRPEVPWREKCYVDATVHWAHRRHSEAQDIFEQILLEHPLDDLGAMMGGFLCHFYNGQNARYRDVPARLLKIWKPDMPNYGYLSSMVAFGCVESNQFTLAEEYGKKVVSGAGIFPEESTKDAPQLAREGEALSINPDDAWAAHALAHVYECTAQSRKGIDFLTKTEKDWKNEHDIALGLFDSYVKPMCLEVDGMFAMTDYTALLKRLEMEGVNVGDRWQGVKEMIRPHLDGHQLIFYDYHMAIGCLGIKDAEFTKKFMDTLRDFVENGSGDVHTKMKRYGSQLVQSLVAFDEGNYARAVDLLNPIRYEFINMAGSIAQTDILPLYLIHAALLSSEPKHHKLARQLIAERQILLPGSPMGERLHARVLAQHID